jgi:hypothetical protein
MTICAELIYYIIIIIITINVTIDWCTYSTCLIYTLGTRFNRATVFDSDEIGIGDFLPLSVTRVPNVKYYIILVRTNQRYDLVQRRRFSKSICIVCQINFLAFIISASRKVNYLGFRKNIVFFWYSNNSRTEPKKKK